MLKSITRMALTEIGIRKPRLVKGAARNSSVPMITRPFSHTARRGAFSRSDRKCSVNNGGSSTIRGSR